MGGRPRRPYGSTLAKPAKPSRPASWRQSLKLALRASTSTAIFSQFPLPLCPRLLIIANDGLRDSPNRIAARQRPRVAEGQALRRHSNRSPTCTPLFGAVIPVLIPARRESGEIG